MAPRSWLTRAGVALLGTTTAVGVFAAPAQAAATGVASVNANGKLTFKAANGKVDKVRIFRDLYDASGKTIVDGGGEGADILRGLGGDDKLYGDNQPAGISDEQVDRLDGGTHVDGDYCAADAEDIAVNCELN